MAINFEDDGDVCALRRQLDVGDRADLDAGHQNGSAGPQAADIGGSSK